MSRVFRHLSRFSPLQNVFSSRRLPEHRLCATRTLSVTSQLYSKSKKTQNEEEDDEELSKPIKFSTSPGSHRHWSVERSMGSGHQRPWWKVLPISALAVCFLLWCALREETELDHMLERTFYEHLTALTGGKEEDEEEEKPS